MKKLLSLGVLAPLLLLAGASFAGSLKEGKLSKAVPLAYASVKTATITGSVYFETIDKHKAVHINKPRANINGTTFYLTNQAMDMFLKMQGYRGGIRSYEEGSGDWAACKWGALGATKVLHFDGKVFKILLKKDMIAIGGCYYSPGWVVGW